MSSLNDEGFMPEIERAARDPIYNGARKVPANLQEFRDAIGRLPAGIVLQEQHGIRQYFYANYDAYRLSAGRRGQGRTRYHRLAGPQGTQLYQARNLAPPPICLRS